MCGYQYASATFVDTVPSKYIEVRKNGHEFRIVIMTGFNHVSVSMTKLQSVVSIRFDSESRLGKRLLILVYMNDRGVWHKRDERVFAS